MTRSVLILMVILFSLSGCEARKVVKKPTPGDRVYDPRVTKSDILASGGTCTASGHCTDTAGRQWNCRGGGYCTRIHEQ
jgi:hypothetical protein